MSDRFEHHKDRAVITLSGPDRRSLLQGIITNNVDHLDDGKGLYAALLTAQGKFLHDFFLVEKNDTIYLDCEADRMAELFQKLLMYRLRSNVKILDLSDHYKIITGTQRFENIDLSYADPRHAKMGYRAIVDMFPQGDTETSYHVRRIKLGIAEGSRDFIPAKSTVLEGPFEQLTGLDYEKGCYVGQEVTARMKYRGKIKKLMMPVTLSGTAPAFGTSVTDEKGNKIGDLRSNCDKNAIVLFSIKDLKFGTQYACGDIYVTPYKPDWTYE